MKKTRQWYYVDGYVEKSDFMTKKKAKKRYDSVFKTYEKAANYRLAGIFAG